MIKMNRQVKFIGPFTQRIFLVLLDIAYSLKRLNAKFSSFDGCHKWLIF